MSCGLFRVWKYRAKSFFGGRRMSYAGMGGNKSPDPISSISGQQSAANYGYVDPYGITAQLKNNLFGGNSPLQSGPMGVYNQNSDQILGQIAGLSGPLQQTLSGLANYQANNAANAVGSNFANQGGLGSGAAAQAFGQAIANPFAQAQAQLQSGQLQAGGSALQSLMGLSGQSYGQALGAGSNLMEQTSALVAPTYMTNPAYTADQQKQQGKNGTLGGIGGAAAGSLLGPVGTALGGSLGNSLTSGK
jgi:hypothetical protein